jgi:cytochrome c biogenesis factor
MIPELGHFALILAALVALIQGVLPLTGTWVRDPQNQVTLQLLARPMRPCSLRWWRLPLVLWQLRF